MKFRKYIALLLIAAIVLSLTACQSSDYKKAVELQETGYFEEAIELFTELGDYKDSSERILETYYTKGESLALSGEYGQAIFAFQSAENYKDAPVQIQNNQNNLYDRGVALVALGNYSEAIQLLEIVIDSYPSDADLSANCYDYLIYCQIKTIDFEDGNPHNLESLRSIALSISNRNRTLREELMSLPQITMVKRLEGTWTRKHERITTENILWEYSLSNATTTITFKDGAVTYKVSYSYPVPSTNNRTYQYSLYYLKGSYSYGDSSERTRINNISESSFTIKEHMAGRSYESTYIR